MMHHGELSFIFDDNEYYEPDPVDVPEDVDGDPLTDESDPGGYVRDEYKIKLKIYYDKRNRLLSDRIPLFSKMIDTIDESSITILECEGDPYHEAVDLSNS